MERVLNVRISISVDFLKAFSEIPIAQQKKVREFVQLFQQNPESPGIHYEPIHAAGDPSLRSVRIDQDYRAIVAKPPAGNVFLLLWVDKHDDAYQWAMRKRLRIHPSTGGIQLIQIDQPEVPQKQERNHRIFEAFSHDQIMRLGVPEELLDRVFAIYSEEELERAEKLFPQEAYNSLFLLACGFSLEEVLAEYNRPAAAVIDTTDFWSALDNDDTLSRFTVVADALELESLLNAPLEQWRVFLHPLQRKIVEMNASGSVRVLGSAGTGKTVVAIHRANYLAQKVFPASNDRILFTTFTKNLAADIRSNLQKICPTEVMTRIDIINLDAWTKNYLEKKNYFSKVIDYDEALQKDLWKKALTLKPTQCAFSDQFFHDEWEQIILPQNVSNSADYFKASRVGRGRRLSLGERKELWPVWEEYRALLNERNLREIQDLYRDAAALLLAEPENLYKAIVVDEGQDFSLQAFSMLRSMLPEGRNDIFIVGDAHQRIYGIKSSLSKSGIKITGRSKKLKVNYRTTAQTYRFASSVLTGLTFDDLDGQDDTIIKCQSLTFGPEPDIKMFSDFKEEKAQIALLINKLIEKGIDPASICLTCRTNSLVEQYAAFLESQSIPASTISHNAAMDGRIKGIRLGTMHRVKGIEFDYVILASACADIIPPKYLLDLQENDIDRKNLIQKERSLLYVALTRARKAAFITCYGKQSLLLRQLAKR